MASAPCVVCVLLLCALACGHLACAQPIRLGADTTSLPPVLVAQLEALGYTVRKAPTPSTIATAEVEPVPTLAQRELDAKIINATKRNDVEGVEKYLALGADLDVTSGVSERSLLHMAANTGGPELIQFLIDAGIDVDVLTIGLATPLHVAVTDNRVEAASLLLENGADLTATTTNGNTPLHWAVTQGHPEVTKLLLDWGADKTVLNANGDIPAEILCCCECGEDSNCTCEDRDALVLLLGPTVSTAPPVAPETPAVDSSDTNETDVGTDLATALALEADPVVVNETVAVPPEAN